MRGRGRIWASGPSRARSVACGSRRHRRWPVEASMKTRVRPVNLKVGGQRIRVKGGRGRLSTWLPSSLLQSHRPRRSPRCLVGSECSFWTRCSGWVSPSPVCLARSPRGRRAGILADGCRRLVVASGSPRRASGPVEVESWAGEDCAAARAGDARDLRPEHLTGAGTGAHWGHPKGSRRLGQAPQARVCRWRGGG